MRSEARAKVLLEQSRQRGLEPARRPMDEHAEVDRAENQTAPRVGTVTRSGARSSTARLARMAFLNSAPVGGAGRINGARAAGREVSTPATTPLAPSAPPPCKKAQLPSSLRQPEWP